MHPKPGRQPGSARFVTYYKVQVFNDRNACWDDTNAPTGLRQRAYRRAGAPVMKLRRKGGSRFDHIRQRRGADHLCDVCSRAGSGGRAAFSFRVVASYPQSWRRWNGRYRRMIKTR